MSDQCHENETQILSRIEEFGLVARCPNGCIHICVGSTALRFSTDQYWKLMELLGDAAQQIANHSATEQDTQKFIQ